MNRSKHGARLEATTITKSNPKSCNGGFAINGDGIWSISANPVVNVGEYDTPPTNAIASRRLALTNWFPMRQNFIEQQLMIMKADITDTEWTEFKQ